MSNLETRIPESDDWHKLIGQLAHGYIEREIELVTELLPNKYYALGVQLGFPMSQSFLSQVNGNVQVHLIDSTREIVCSQKTSECQLIYSNAKQLPFGRKSADLIIMPHTLDLHSEPIQILREVSQIIDDDGTLVVTGYNPASLFGVSKFLSKHIGRRKGLTISYGPGRIKEWLQLIGFEIYSSCYLDYLPPVNHSQLRSSLGFLNQAGDRWWPMFAGIYIILAKKKDWKPQGVSMFDSIKKRLKPKFPQSATQRRG